VTAQCRLRFAGAMRRESSLSTLSASCDVTVVVPTHNRSALLEQTLQTVLWQEGVDLEVIVVDDGSTDDTENVVRTLDNHRIRLVRHDAPRGVSLARNRGIQEARGEWIAFLDDDDLWAPNKLATQLWAAKRAGRDWVYAGEITIGIDKRIIGAPPIFSPQTVAELLPRVNLVPGGCSGVIVSRRFLLTDSPFDETYLHFADWDLWIRLAARGMPAWVPRPVVGYRVHASSASHDTEGMVAELDMIEARYGEPVDRATFLRHVGRVSLRGGKRRQALRYYLQAAVTGDSRYLTHGFVPDIWEVLDERIQAFGRRRGWRIPQITFRNLKNTNRAWQEEAAQWLQLVPPIRDDPRG
jgi:glycosyltransferase involved in cell wall biosynthesis